MGFSTEWEQTYKSNAQLSVWPWSEVISLTHRFCDLNKDLIVLELGCGAGANIPYFMSLNNGGGVIRQICALLRLRRLCYNGKCIK